MTTTHNKSELIPGLEDSIDMQRASLFGAIEELMKNLPEDVEIRMSEYFKDSTGAHREKLMGKYHFLCSQTAVVKPESRARIEEMIARLVEAESKLQEVKDTDG